MFLFQRKTLKAGGTLTPAQIQEKDKAARWKVCEEMLSTEESYVTYLDAVVDVFERPLQTAIASGHPIISKEEVAAIFANISMLLPLHQQFLQQLRNTINEAKDCKANPKKAAEKDKGKDPKDIPRDRTDATEGVVSALLSFSPYFKMYTQFVNNYGAAAELLSDLSDKDGAKRNKSFMKFLSDAAKNPKCKGQSLGSLLVNPVQRIPRYKLLLTELGKRVSSTSESEKITKALGLIENVASHINEALRNKAASESLIQLQTQFMECPIPFLEPRRVFITRGLLFFPILPGVPTNKQFVCEVVLFNDICVLAKRKKKDLFKFVTSFPIVADSFVQSQPNYACALPRFLQQPFANSALSTKKEKFQISADSGGGSGPSSPRGPGQSGGHAATDKDPFHKAARQIFRVVLQRQQQRPHAPMNDTTIVDLNQLQLEYSGSYERRNATVVDNSPPQTPPLAKGASPATASRTLSPALTTVSKLSAPNSAAPQPPPRPTSALRTASGSQLPAGSAQHPNSHSGHFINTAPLPASHPPAPFHAPPAAPTAIGRNASSYVPMASASPQLPNANPVFQNHASGSGSGSGSGSYSRGGAGASSASSLSPLTPPLANASLSASQAPKTMRMIHLPDVNAITAPQTRSVSMLNLSAPSNLLPTSSTFGDSGPLQMQDDKTGPQSPSNAAPQMNRRSTLKADVFRFPLKFYTPTSSQAYDGPALGMSMNMTVSLNPGQHGRSTSFTPTPQPPTVPFQEIFILSESAENRLAWLNHFTKAICSGSSADVRDSLFVRSVALFSNDVAQAMLQQMPAAGSAAAAASASPPLNVNFRHFHGYTALHYAAFTNNIALCTALVAKGADVNAVTQDGMTPLMLSARQGHNTVSEIFLKHVDTDLTVTKDGSSAFDLNDDVVVMAAELIADRALIAAAKLGHWSLACHALVHQASVHVKDNSKHPFHAPANAPNAVVVAAGALSASSSGNPFLGWSALQICSYLGYGLLLDLFLEFGADANVQSADGRTPLMFSIEYDHERCVSVLLDFFLRQPASLNLELRDAQKRSAKDYAAKKPNIIKIFAEKFPKKKEPAKETAAPPKEKDRESKEKEAPPLPSHPPPRLHVHHPSQVALNPAGSSNSPKYAKGDDKNANCVVM